MTVFLRRRILFILMLCLALCGALQAQAQKGTLTGHVSDASQAVIQNARVVVNPGNLTTTSDALGDFVLAGLAPGSYTVTVTSVGFKPLTQSVSVAAGQTVPLNAVMQVASGGEQVVVSAGSGQDMIQAVNEEISSPDIVNVMPEAEILALPNANVADAIGRLPGVTVQRDEGEAVYVQVRGLDPRLTNTTIDGVTIPSPESNVRQVLLATIPADMVQSIELNKTLSANQDADGIGGSVNMVTKLAGESPTFTAVSTLGYSPIMNGRYMGLAGFTLGQRFGVTKRWGAIASASYDYNGRGYNDIEPTPDLNNNTFAAAPPFYDDITLREYRQARLRWGGTTGIDYKLSDHSSLAAHAILTDFKDWGDKWTYTVNTLGKPGFKYSIRHPDFMIGSFSLGGNHIFANKWFTWGTAISRSREVNAGGNPGGAFDPTPELKSWATANCNFAGLLNGDPYRPQWTPTCMLPNTTSPADNIYTLSNYTLDNINTSTGAAMQLNLQEWGAMGFNYHLGTHSATLEFGGEFRNAHKGQDAYTPTFDYCPNPKADPGYPTNDPCNPQNTSVTPVSSQLFASGFMDPHYYDGTYHMGEVTDHYKVDHYMAENPGLLPLDVPATRIGSDTANYNLVERVTAGYVMNTFNLNRLRLQMGLRLEATNESGVGYLVNPSAGPYGDGFDVNGNWIGTTPITNSQSYIDPLPSIQARYAFTPETAVRAVYARGISRPNQYDLVPYVNPTGNNPVVADIGSPNELPTHANDYDLLLEQELKPFGLIEAGFFYKQLTNPIVASNVQCTGACAIFATAGQVNLATQNINGSSADVWGFEIGLQQKFSNLPGGFRGLGLVANYSYSSSQINGLPDRLDSPALVGTAPQAFNLEPSYDLGRYFIHMGMSYNGANIYAYQYYSATTNAATLPGVCSNLNQSSNTAQLNGPVNGPCGDNYFYPHFQVDAQMGARLYKGLRLQLEGLNLTNEVFGFYNGSPQYMTQREYYKPTYSASLRWDSGREK
jgi:TonB-dependent receptor